MDSGTHGVLTPTGSSRKAGGLDNFAYGQDSYVGEFSSESDVIKWINGRCARSVSGAVNAALHRAQD
jgi:hypothetical protein